jgi:MFS family permease
VSAAIIVPQAVVVACSPWVGRLAQTFGRRPLLLIGFAALPVRGLLFATAPGAVPLVAMQLLDGVSATVFGLMMPLIAADLTRRTGYLNLAIGALGLAAGLGATASTTAAGVVADRFGAPAAFLGLAVIGFAAVALIWWMMPETRPRKSLIDSPALVAA